MAAQKKITKTKTKKGDTRSIEILVSVPKDASVESIAESASVVVKEPDGSKEVVEAAVVEETVDQSGNDEEVPAAKAEETQVTEAVGEGGNEESQETSGKSFKKIFLWVGLLILVVGILAVFWALAYERGVKVGEQNTEKKMSASPKPEAPPSATPSPQATKSSTYTIKVLNGSGISAEASKVKALLEKGDYSVSSIGNADSTSNGETVIQTTNAVSKTWIDTLKKLLSQTYTVSSDVQTIAQDQKADVIITVGSKKTQ